MFNLGEKVVVTLIGEITEIRKVGCDIRYTVAGDRYQQAYVQATSIMFPRKDKEKEK